MLDAHDDGERVERNALPVQGVMLAISAVCGVVVGLLSGDVKVGVEAAVAVLAVLRPTPECRCTDK